MFQPDEAQREVISLHQVSALVLAAPGCGKTEILTQRVLHAHDTLGVPYDEMLCLTFTNRASREMRDRLRKAITMPSQGLFVGNIHRFCIRFLIDNELLPLNVALIDDEDQKDILEELYGRPLKSTEVTQVLREAQHLHQQEHAHPRHLWLHPEVTSAGSLARSYREYKAHEQLVDFDDLLLLTYDYLSRPDRPFYLYDQFSWVQVDEVQDLNALQLAIVELIAPAEGATRIFLGDEQQSIFSFIGAKASTMQRIRTLCADHLYRLYSNHRSPAYLVSLLNDYAVEQLHLSPELLPEATRTDEPSPGDLLAVDSESPQSLPDDVARLAQAATVGSRGTVGVLVRTNAMGQRVGEALEKRGVPHLLISNRDVFKRVDFKTLLAHFSVSVDDTRHSDWARLLYQLQALKQVSLAQRFVRRLKQLALTPADLMAFPGSSYTMMFEQLATEGDFVVFDTETTGLDVHSDDIIQIAAVKVSGGRVVEGSELDIIIATQRPIPATLAGGLENPMVAEYARRPHLSPAEGLTLFMQYVGHLPLVGHNVEYDLRILSANLKRATGQGLDLCHLTFFDTLKVAKLLDPNLRRHKLGFLLERYALEGVNSHNAIDDVRATVALALHMSSRIAALRPQQLDFISHRAVQAVAQRLDEVYRPIYGHTRRLLRSDQRASDGYTLAAEMRHVHDGLVAAGAISPVDHFHYILQLVDDAVTDATAEPYFHQQAGQHLYELRTFTEADLFQQGIVREQVHVMTIHKAKGLQFDSVIVCDATHGVFPPQWAHEFDETARLLYVAMSRAQRRLAVSFVGDATFLLDGVVARFVHSTATEAAAAWRGVE